MMRCVGGEGGERLSFDAECGQRSAGKCECWLRERRACVCERLTRKLGPDRKSG